MKSDGVVLENKGTYQDEAKSESGREGKILGLFDDDSYTYREERNLRRIGSSAVFVSFRFQQLSLLCFIVFLFNL
jgi:hypothetical protein